MKPMTIFFHSLAAAALLGPVPTFAQEVRRCGNLYTNLRCPDGVRSQALRVPLRVDRTAAPADQARARFTFNQRPAEPAAARFSPREGRTGAFTPSAAAGRTVSPTEAIPTGQAAGRLAEAEREIVAAKAHLDVLCRTHAVATDAAARAVCANALENVTRAGMPLPR